MHNNGLMGGFGLWPLLGLLLAVFLVLAIAKMAKRK